ncbi:MAG: putative toxin-antitoxin system toxin component, PIN family [Desulfovermiculus sp.]
MIAKRFVVDTNVLISAALLSTSTPAKFLDALKESRAILLFSTETQIELQTRIMKNKFDQYVSLEKRQRLLAQMDAVSEYISIINRPMGCRDQDDNKFLETAVIGKADCLVTGDNDLLAMDPFQGIPILLPAKALAYFFR